MENEKLYIRLSKDHNASDRRDDDQLNESYEAFQVSQLKANAVGQQSAVQQPVGQQLVEDEQSRSDNESQMYREQDLYLPITNISRIMKKSLPENFAKLSKESKTIMQECVSEFISFIASEAAETVRYERRLTLNGDDVINAMERLGFRTLSSNYIDPLKLYLKKYRQSISATTDADSPASSGPPTTDQ